MSLSKYYKCSNLFQPEELIKREEKTISGWQSLQPKEISPFQNQQLPDVSDPKNETQKTEIPQNKVNPADNTSGKDQQTILGKEQSTPPPPENGIDLSQYLELTIANKKIEEAYQKGLKKGTDKVKQDYGDATRALLITCQQLDTLRETIINNSSKELQDFALAIAERILRISVCEQDSTIIATIEEALQRAVKSDEFFIYINPDDYETVEGNSSELVAGLSGLNKIVIKKDSTVERGGAKIESDNCTIDATIAGQFDVIREEIKKNL